MLERLRTWARALCREIAVLAAAARDPRTPWYVRALALAVVAYALSPIDLIPDFVPVLGQLDDLVLLPAGLWLVRRLIEPAILAEHRARVPDGARLAPGRAGALIVVALWMAALALAARWLMDRAE